MLPWPSKHPLLCPWQEQGEKAISKIMCSMHRLSLVVNLAKRSTVANALRFMSIQSGSTYVSYYHQLSIPTQGFPVIARRWPSPPKLDGNSAHHIISLFES